jgi:serine/threonine protein kinase
MFMVDDVEQRDELIGTYLGGVKVLALIGQGGMSRVYHGYQEHLDRDVALKVLPPYYITDTSFIDRFQIEARALARLQHPNIVVLYDGGRQGQWLYLVMELIHGKNLRQRMQQSMTINEAVHIIKDVAEALTFAHEQGVIHRDVKPVNVLLDETKATPFPRAVLSDFGIAKILQGSAQVTRTGTGIGTPEYMAPEQCKGSVVDARTDIYSLGIMLYEMLCGRPPFVAEEYTAVAHSQIYDAPPPPMVFNPRITISVQDVIMKALQKRPEQRFSNARDMAKALEDAVARSPRNTLASRPIIIECPRCQTENPAGMNFCRSCGVNLRGGPPAPLAPSLGITLPPVTCLSCGSSNPGVNRFCNRCGARLSTIICANCGRANPQGQGICLSCNMPLSQSH